MIDFLEDLKDIPEHLQEEILMEINSITYERFRLLDPIGEIYSNQRFFERYHQKHTVITEEQKDPLEKKDQYNDGMMISQRKINFSLFKQGYKQKTLIRTTIFGPYKTIEEFYINGNIKEISRWKNGIKDGDEEHRNINGTLDFIKRWKNGKQDGNTEGYHYDGSKWYLEQWKDGKIISCRFF